jgi:hypothetical protein
MAALGLLATASASLAAPANDNFSAATVVSATTGTLPAVATATATAEAGEPNHAGITGGRSIWHRFLPAVKDRFVITTAGSNFDTTLAAYTGSAVNSLTEVTSNDDIPSGGTTSNIECSAGPANPVSVAIDGYQGATGNAVLNWSPATLTNNNFSSAIALSGVQGGVNGWSFRATAEAGEPNAGPSVWYTWTTPSSTTGQFTLTSADMASFIGIYTGSSVGALTQVTTATAAAGANALVSFNAVSGTVYHIQVKGSTGGTGDFLLSWGLNSGSTVLLPDIISHASQADNFMYGWTLDQTEIPGRTLLRVSTATANVGAGKLELRGSSANPAVYQRIYNANGTWTDRLAGTFTFHPTHGHLHFDGWLQFYLRTVTAGNGVGDIIAAGDKTSFAIIDLQPHNLTLPGAPSSGAYSGGLLQGISVGWRDIYDKSLDDQWIDVTSVPPGTYWLESAVDPDNLVLESDETNNVTRILITYTGSAPPNNAFASAAILTGASAATSGRNFSATKESSEPNHAGNTGGKSVWYRWTATYTGPVTVSTAGSSFDTLVGVYTGSAVNGLTTVASSDDDSGLLTSRVTFNAVSGTTYRFAVDGKGGAAGSIEFALNPARNDMFADMQTITGTSGTVSGSNRGATAGPGEPAHAGSAAAQSLWYFWTAPLTGDAAFSSEGSSFNTRLAVYTGGALNALTPVASATGSGFEAPATVNFHVDSGTGYLIAIDGGPGVTALTWQAATAIAPYIISHPPTGNHQEGTNLQIAALIGGSPTLTFQWRYNENIITDGLEYSGTTTPTLTVRKLEFADSGSYTLTGTNPSGSVTTNPANIIVLANPRTVTINDAAGDIGGSVFAPVMLNATGNENGVQFSLVWDPALLGNGRVTAGAQAAGASIVLDRSQEAAGRLGVTLTLPGGALFPAGLQHILDLQLDAAPSAPAGVTPLAFDGTPVLHHALSASGATLPAVFDPANITLSPVQAGVTSAPSPGGGTTFTVRGLRGKTYQLLQSPDLGAWTVVQSQTIGASGTAVFTLPASANLRGFFKAAPAP